MNIQYRVKLLSIILRLFFFEKNTSKLVKFEMVFVPVTMLLLLQVLFSLVCHSYINKRTITSGLIKYIFLYKRLIRLCIFIKRFNDVCVLADNPFLATFNKEGQFFVSVC